jgi:transposase
MRGRELIRQQWANEQLFYTHEEIAKPAASNFYMRLSEAVRDWERLAEPFRNAFSATTGRPTDPVVYLKMFLVAYLENITYDTDLAERISDSIAIRRFLGYALSESTPDHSSISRNRGLIAGHCRIEDVLTKVVELCRKTGLVDGELSVVDASLVPANASLSSLRSVRTGKRVAEHLKEVAEKNKESALSGESPKQKKPTVSNEEFRSGTDPDARIAKKPGQPKDMYYKMTHLTDGKSGIVVAAGAAHADEGETEAAEAVVLEAKENLARCGISLEDVVADAGYDSANFHAYIEGLDAVPVMNWRSDTTKKPDGFRKESFIYCEEANCYMCPRGCLLRYNSFCKSTGLMLYTSDPKDCAGCESRSECIDGKARRRTVSRHPKEESRERNIARCHTDEGRRALGRRKGIVEGPFGHMKTYGGLGLISCRGRAKANVKVVMAAVAYNLVKLVRAKADGACSAKACRDLLSVVQRSLRAYWRLLVARKPKRASSPPYSPGFAAMLA